jgi:hypothetical protein
MPAGRRLIEIHNPLLAIDGLGNLCLDTQGKLAEQIAAGNIPAFGGKGIPTGVVISAAAGAVQYYSDVTFQVSDLTGTAVAGVYVFDIWLSDAATGAGLTGTTASGGISAETSGGVVLSVYTAAKALKVQTNTSGAFVLRIIDSAKTGFYPVANVDIVPNIGAQLVAANYHA